MLHLGVNVDHVATLRQGAARALSRPGVRGADRRAGGRRQHHDAPARRPPAHPGPRHPRRARDVLQTRMNLEMAATDEMVRIACEVRPADCCLVPEHRAEVTTEGGLDVAAQVATLGAGRAGGLRDAGIRVSLFIDPDPRSSTRRCASARRSSSCTPAPTPKRAASSRRASWRASARRRAHASSLGLTVHAGHGLQLSQRAADRGDPARSSS